MIGAVTASGLIQITLASTPHVLKQQFACSNPDIQVTNIIKDKLFIITLDRCKISADNLKGEKNYEN